MASTPKFVVTKENLQRYHTNYVKPLKEESDRIRALAEGRSRGLVADDYEALVTALEAMAQPTASNKATTLQMGDQIYIKALNQVDMWVTEALTTKAPAITAKGTALTTLIEDGLKTTAGINIGWYNLAELEAAKVDLNGYYTKSELDPTINKVTNLTKAVTETGTGDLVGGVAVASDGTVTVTKTSVGLTVTGTGNGVATLSSTDGTSALTATLTTFITPTDMASATANGLMSSADYTKLSDISYCADADIDAIINS